MVVKKIIELICRDGAVYVYVDPPRGVDAYVLRRVLRKDAWVGKNLGFPLTHIEPFSIIRINKRLYRLNAALQPEYLCQRGEWQDPELLKY